MRRQHREQVLTLKPDRISFFGYAHVPWLKKHQSMIDIKALPDSDNRMMQANLASELLRDAGYIRIGFDHFALPGDEMAKSLVARQLKRNFQGCTLDNAAALIGFGASAISKLPQGYIQNIAAIGQYQQSIERDGLAVTRGFELGEEDRMRGYLIEKLMCDLEFSKTEIFERFGDAAMDVIDEATELLRDVDTGFLTATKDGFRVTEKGRPHLRTICAHFDPYFKTEKARHSLAV